MAGTPRKLDLDATREMMQQTDTLLLDLDGVLWSGDQTIKGVPETLRMLQHETEPPRQVLYVTNNAMRTRAQILNKFESHGISATADQIFSSASVTARHMRTTLGEGAKVYVVGTKGLAEEIRAVGLEPLHDLSIASSENVLTEPLVAVDPEIKAVVVGLDPTFHYNKLVYATMCLRTLPNCQFVATNEDSTLPFSEKLYPGAGSIVAAVATAVGRRPTVIGKPQQEMMRTIIDSLSLSRDRCLMVGDRLDTDIQFGNDGGVRTLLVLTGVATEEDGIKAPERMRPTFCTSSLSDLMEWR